MSIIIDNIKKVGVQNRNRINKKNENEYIHVYEKILEDGSYAYAFFNLGEKNCELKLNAQGSVLDAWAKKELAEKTYNNLTLYSHATRIFKCKNKIDMAML